MLLLRARVAHLFESRALHHFNSFKKEKETHGLQFKSYLKYWGGSESTW